ncbi:MAG TPA: NAD(P)-dependent oxidoreductase [Pyrinomonadaceae bacterium]|nr:NAD(P)-dependent oxidoreductase [Pyrinomonadaceae bacterium]
MKRVLVTGATGFVGRHTLAPLTARGYEVHAASSRARVEETDARAARVEVETTRDVRGEETTREVSWHACDLLRKGAAAELVAEVRPTHLLHMAWYAEPGKFWTADVNTEWVRASRELFDEFARRGGERVVASGTCAEYAWGHGEGICTEGETPLQPSTLYGMSKLVAYNALVSRAQSGDFSVAWGRIFFLYGPHEHPARLVSSVIRALLRGERVALTHGRQVRDFLHVEDVASAFVALLDTEVEGPVNIASGRAVTLRDLIERIADALDGRQLVDFGARPAPEGEPPVLVADVRRLREEVGWRPRYDLDEGLRRTIAWWREREGVGDDG